MNAALGAARRSGKNRVWAESFTDGWPELASDDWSFEKLKPIADRYFHAGVNATILHVVISQPGDDRQPAVRGSVPISTVAAKSLIVAVLRAATTARRSRTSARWNWCDGLLLM